MIIIIEGYCNLRIMQAENKDIIHKKYTIGKIEVTFQSFVVLLAGATISGVMLLVSILFLNQPLSRLVGLGVSLITFGMTCYLGYTINCVIVGKCVAFAWFLVIVSMFVFISYAGIIITLGRTQSMGKKKMTH